jgi:hypothetical protein
MRLQPRFISLIRREICASSFKWKGCLHKFLKNCTHETAAEAESVMTLYVQLKPPSSTVAEAFFRKPTGRPFEIFRVQWYRHDSC